MQSTKKSKIMETQFQKYYNDPYIDPYHMKRLSDKAVLLNKSEIEKRKKASKQAKKMRNKNKK